MTRPNGPIERRGDQVRILVTGAGRAIGQATAMELARRGHHVIATARDIGLLHELNVAQRLALDVTNTASVTNALDAAGDIDAIVNNAAVAGAGPLESYPLDRLRADAMARLGREDGRPHWQTWT